MLSQSHPLPLSEPVGEREDEGGSRDSCSIDPTASRETGPFHSDAARSLKMVRTVIREREEEVEMRRVNASRSHHLYTLD